MRGSLPVSRLPRSAPYSLSIDRMCVRQCGRSLLEEKLIGGIASGASSVRTDPLLHCTHGGIASGASSVRTDPLLHCTHGGMVASWQLIIKTQQMLHHLTFCGLAIRYRHLHLDDCWAATQRNGTGHIQPGECGCRPVRGFTSQDGCASARPYKHRKLLEMLFKLEKVRVMLWRRPRPFPLLFKLTALCLHDAIDGAQTPSVSQAG